MEKHTMPDEKDNAFKTSDIKFAAFLKAAAVPFLGCEGDSGDRDGRRKVFLFENVDGLRELRQQFFSRQPDSLATLTVFNEYDALKSYTYD